MRFTSAVVRFWTALACLALTALLPVSATAESPWGRNYFPNSSLVTQDGKTVKFYDDVIHGKIVIINFIFTNCGDVCPLDTAQLRKVQSILGDRIGKDIFMYSISVDPVNDTPAALRDYMKKYDIGPGWTFLTGKLDDINQIQQKLGVAPANGTPSQHSTTVIVGNEATGQWIKRSPYENPNVLANLVGGHLDPKGVGGDKDRQSYANAQQVKDMDRGESLYRTRCASCHQIGGGESLGPDLMMVSSRRDPEWLRRWIKEPDKMIAEGDPIATAQLAQFRNLPMPNLKLGDIEVDALLAFIDSESAKAAEIQQAAEHAHHHH